MFSAEQMPAMLAVTHRSSICWNSFFIGWELKCGLQIVGQFGFDTCCRLKEIGQTEHGALGDHLDKRVDSAGLCRRTKILFCQSPFVSYEFRVDFFHGEHNANLLKGIAHKGRKRFWRHGAGLNDGDESEAWLFPDFSVRLIPPAAVGARHCVATARIEQHLLRAHNHSHPVCERDSAAVCA